VRTAAGDFMTGLMVPLRGIELIFTRPRIRHAAIIPFIVVLAVFLIGTVVGLPFLFQLVPALAHAALAFAGVATASGGELTSFAAVLYWVLVLISLPVGVFALLFVLFLVSQLIAAPFYAILAERVLVETGMKADQTFRPGAWLLTNLRLFGVALVKVSIFAVLGGALFLFSLIPGLGLFAAFGLLMMTAYDIADVSFEALEMGLRERFRFFRDEIAAFAGLAAGLGLVFMIPGLNFFLFPAAIAGTSAILARARRSA